MSGTNLDPRSPLHHRVEQPTPSAYQLYKQLWDVHIPLKHQIPAHDGVERICPQCHVDRIVETLRDE
jgi:hypothetical protein